MVKILIVEDDERLNKVISATLRQESYDIVSVLNAFDALTQLFEQSIDLVISDIMMPKMDGFQLASKIRAINSDMPIIFMTAKDDLLSKETGFRLGIDDYLVKPVNMSELIWRIKAILRRANISEQNRIQIDQFVLDKRGMTATNNHQEISLTAREFNLLYKLLSYPNQAFSREQLMDEFWKFDSNSTSRSVDVYITKLRDKLHNVQAFQIKTIYGIGYKAVIK
ncbi:response regulator transcription factor [Lentilactobacillus farraginis]|uniref:Heme response regulator HssR n=1 Tax=Lentilactobacillus farraginis DSM 18382 = JCM 14108 TaxID=1423743 RepID=X0PG45_9LACO|nr:response regulator transcription factor [Lentilactobacillus farraginis]KRM08460.1 DNA-binding response regulator [Lentilactobacillus farraginis DSM 18382 = JCM 14108]GAF35917.1 DNA-binding response regulator, OmpR family [Lentilactobacillus farraginis DSM 18382 = JCM 14108]